MIRTQNALTNKENVQATELALLYRSKNGTYVQIVEKLNEIHYFTHWHKQFDGPSYNLPIKQQRFVNWKLPS
jgi:hypothetical protein